ncbi:hypothetical protein HMPREF1868_00213 [Olsenella sp. DNF00959]|nr:hypothetical protein HMPREF1868_00213 [Olsenella sp. DNF00959]
MATRWSSDESYHNLIFWLARRQKVARPAPHSRIAGTFSAGIDERIDSFVYYLR